MTVPCKDCADREVGCHANCQRYRDYAAERENVRQIKAEANDVTNMHMDAQIRRWTQIWRRTKS